MPRPEKIIWGGPPPPPFLKRVRRRLGVEWARYRMQREKERYRRRQSTPAARQVAFIFGCQRSGTNMTLRMLNRSTDVDGIEESDPRAFRFTRILGKDVRDRVIRRSTAKCILFKPICDSHRALELLAEHPGSRALWVYRRYQDVANSAVERWHDQTRVFIEDLLEGGGDWGLAQWNREKLSAECLQEVREACVDGLTPHGACALFWYMRNRLFFEQDLKRNPTVLITGYEDAVRQPDEEFMRLAEFLDIAIDPEMTEKVFSSSVRKRAFPPVSERIGRLCDGMMERLDRARAATPQTAQSTLSMNS